MGHFSPPLGVDMKPFGDLFIKLMKMVIASVVFCTIGNGSMGNIKQLGLFMIMSQTYTELD